MVTRELVFTTVDNDSSWDELVNGLNGNPLQLSGWGELKKRAGWQVERIAVYDTASNEHTPLALAQVLYKPLPLGITSFAYIPRGPVMKNLVDAPHVYTEIVKHIKQRRRVIAVSIEPDVNQDSIALPKPFRRASNHILPIDTLILDLCQSEEDLLKGMSKKHRQYIRKSSRDTDVVIKSVNNEAEFEQCLEVYHQTSERADFALHGDDYYRDAFHCLKDSGRVWASYVDGKIVAFLFNTYSDKTSYELWGGATEIGQKLRANYAMKWLAIREMKEHGVERYDFGGLIGEGVTRFKLGFKANPDKLLGSWDYPGLGYALWRYGVPLLRKVKSFLRRARG